MLCQRKQQDVQKTVTSDRAKSDELDVVGGESVGVYLKGNVSHSLP